MNGTKLDFLRSINEAEEWGTKKRFQAWLSSLAGVLSHAPKGYGFDSRTGHIPRF